MSRSPVVTGIILAAGRGIRMGTSKLLLPFRSSTILECTVDSALASRLQRVIVVLGHDAGTIEPLMKGRNVKLAINHLYEQGQSTTLKAGLKLLDNDTDAALFLLGDQPMVTAETINLILDAYKASPSSPIVLPVFDGLRGNPVLFSRQTFSRIENITGDHGARTLFDEYAEKILEVPVDDPSIHFDIDTVDDYNRLMQSEGYLL